MSSSFKIKVVAAGWEPAKKDFFQKCKRNINSFFNGCYITVGVDIKTASYSNEYDDRLTMGIWDINSSGRFRFIYPTFFKGAAACLLFYDISIPQSFEQLNDLMQHIRSDARYIPIFVIAYKSHIKDKTNFEEINDFIEANDIAGFYLMAIRKEFRASQIFDEITVRISEYIFYHRAEMPKISDNEKRLYKKFISAFSRCPICLGKNHKSNLSRVFFSKDSRTKKLKENLVDLMNFSENFDDNYLNKIKIGIPCCSCHNKIFS
ncbi:MAG: hypothetical protein ACXACC_00275 [Promethearchaeota archaeon]|jgi:GTPase SAR1 family protein